MPTIFARSAVASAAAHALALGLTFSSVSAPAADFTSELTASDDSGVPNRYTSEQWLAAQGEAAATLDADEHVVRVVASSLVPDGLYTIWWVNPGIIGVAMGPGGGVPNNEFRADSDGTADVAIRVPADNDYQDLVVAYHADDQTHGEQPGDMGEVTFQHLTGPWPGPEE